MAHAGVRVRGRWRRGSETVNKEASAWKVPSITVSQVSRAKLHGGSRVRVAAGTVQVPPFITLVVFCTVQ